ncbi:MAG: 30S ribosomal protein S15 [Elusimicrobia bacterium RIFCSPLOWO2_01_FULL_64_13]|nr:MAG: 30S ribosomal protein S15 [Elusimicrobia bacterium RIFCSPHIGHO2_01_FULL_64_10]OGR97569.1 MAG: 30S ribosomal protein S15 [Elusimicrobia bacterium RIFCSPLOWO2_01_FULL_64_13]
MAITKEAKKTIIDEYRANPKDSGSSAVQIAILTRQIENLANHFKAASKDYASRQGLLKMVSRRKQLLNYLKKSSPERYQQIIQKLDLRK